MRVMSQRERKLVALLILFMILGLVWLVIVGPIFSGFSERAADRTRLIQQYQANQRVIGSIPRLRRQAERQREQLRNFGLTAPTQAAAVGALQNRVERAIADVDGEVQSVEDLSDGTPQIRIRASARMTLAQMTAVIMRLGNDPPYPVVESLQLSADQAAISGRLDVMEVGFEVSVPYVGPQSR